MLLPKLGLLLCSLGTLSAAATVNNDGLAQRLSRKADIIYRHVLETTQKNPKEAPVPPEYLLRSGRILDEVFDYGDTEQHCQLLTKVLLQTYEEALIATFTWDKLSTCGDFARTALHLLNERAEARNSTIRVYLLIDAFSELNMLKKYPAEMKVDPKDLLRTRNVAKPQTFGFNETYPHLDFVVKTFHKGLVGSMHTKMLVVDGQYVAFGSKNWEIQPFYEYSLATSGSIVEPFRKDFEGLWGSPLPPLKSPAVATVGGSVPMVYLARKPNGHLLSNSNNNAQNQAWLKAIEVAQKYVVIISPNIATKSFAQKLLDAIRRGVKVVLIAAYGMHDIGEALYPDSLGSNTRSFAYMRKKLNPLERNRLQACFFITSRTTPPRPLKTAWVHTKYLDVDGEFAIIGSGNIDSQSFYYSSESNVLIDDAGQTKRTTAKMFMDHPTLQNCYYDDKNHYDATSFWTPFQ